MANENKTQESDNDYKKARKIVLEFIGEEKKKKDDDLKQAAKEISAPVVARPNAVIDMEFIKPTPVAVKKEEIKIEKKVIKDVKKDIIKTSKEKIKISAVAAIKKSSKPKTDKLGWMAGVDVKRAFRNAVKLIGFCTLIYVVAVAVFYMAFVLYVVNFKADNSFTRKVDGYLPVPAIISKIGVIKYYDYQDAAKRGLEGDIKFELIKRLLADKTDNPQISDQEVILQISGMTFWSLVE